jgi:16S rRNA (cytosine967-C5)-methyltransferase
VTGPPRPGQKARPRRAKPRPDLPRRVAFELLRAVAERDAYANLTLPALLREHGLDTRDAAFTTELAYGTLRGQGTYDVVLAACVDRPLDQVDPPVLDLLRLGAHQLLGMRVPSHAAVGATVELARAVAGEGRGSFVNAVLRRVGRHDLATWLAEVAPAYDTDPVGNLAVVHSHPRWVVSALRDSLGGSLTQTADLLSADNVPPLVTLVARPGRATVAELAEAGAGPGRWSPYAAGAARRRPGWHPCGARRAGRGAGRGQPAGGARAGRRPRRGLGRPLAGPVRRTRWQGGPARSRRGGRDAALLAAEVAPHRAGLVARVVGDTAGVVVADGRVPAWRPAAFDRVLVDAPCTGLGALRRRPEARWRRRLEDVAGLTALQGELLRAGLDAVRPGGLVAYVTCSPHLAETRSVVLDVLHRERAAGHQVDRVDARPFLPGVPDLGDGPDVQLWPHLHGTDAMYLSLLRRG